eukprot:2981217-Prorocentrum_lima.AAC.1
MVSAGLDLSSRTRFIPMRAHFVHDLVHAQLVTVECVANGGNAASVLTKGLGAATHSNAIMLICLAEQEQ